MAYKLVCDKCGAPINPESSRIVVGYDIDCWHDPKEKYELCVSCARRFKHWMNSSFPIVIGERKEAAKMAEPRPCPFCGKHLMKKTNHNRLPSGKVIDYTYWMHEDSYDCILGALLTERKGSFLLESDIEQWNRRW